MEHFLPACQPPRDALLAEHVTTSARQREVVLPSSNLDQVFATDAARMSCLVFSHGVVVTHVVVAVGGGGGHCGCR